MSFSHFGELWLAGSHGGGITSGRADWSFSSHSILIEW